MNTMFYGLGASLAKAIGEEEIICRGVLRMTIKDSVEHLRDMADPDQATTATIAYMKKMTYQDWKAVIEGPALSECLASIGIKESAPVVTQLKQVLVEQQSLLTMTAY